MLPGLKEGQIKKLTNKRNNNKQKMKRIGRSQQTILVVCLVASPLNESEAGVDLIFIET